jgi:tetratricopeptide (TPR) repeat protein
MPRKATASKEKAYDVGADGPDSAMVSRARTELERGKALFDKDDIKAAAPVLEDALALMTKARAGPGDRIEVLVSISNAYIDSGNLERGEALALEAMGLIGKPGIPVVLKGKATHMMGQTMMRKGDPAAALKHLERAFALFETAGNREWMAHTSRAIGNSYVLMSLYSKAIVYYNRSIKLYQEAGREREVWYVRNNIALSMGLQGNYSDAIKELEVVLVNVTRLEDRNMVAMCHSNMGFFHQHLGQFDRALQHYEEGLRIARAEGNIRVDSSAIIGMVDVAVGKGDIDGALRMINENFKALMATKSNELMGQALKSRGTVYRERGELKKAEDDFALAERMLVTGNDRVTLAELYIEWARTMAKANEKGRARGLFDRAGAIYRELTLPLLQKELEKAMKDCGL